MALETLDASVVDVRDRVNCLQVRDHRRGDKLAKFAAQLSTWWSIVIGGRVLVSGSGRATSLTCQPCTPTQSDDHS